MKINEPLNKAYYLKEELKEVWRSSSKEQATRSLDLWIYEAIRSGVGMLKRFAKSLNKHREGILAYHDYAISTGPLEGTNNKIKTMQRQAYGYRDEEFLKLKIKAIHETKHTLI